MRFPYWFLTVGYGLAVLVLMTRPVPDVPTPSIPHEDKIAHFVVYAGLATIISVGIRRSNPTATPLHQLATPFLFSTGYGAFCEFLQRLIPYRTFDWWDIAANSAGALTAQLALAVLFWLYLDTPSRSPVRESAGGP